MIFILILLCASCSKDSNPVESTPKSDGTVTDIDGNIYNYITIGNQTWMQENLKTTKYRNGDALPNVTTNGDWIVLKTGTYCDYNNNPTNAEIYGRLYNWYAVNDTRGLAPLGWHVASDSEWTKLINYLGGESVAGSKLKKLHNSYWQTSDIVVSNSSGFEAIPSGFRNIDGSFVWLGYTTYWWTSTVDNFSAAWNRHLHYDFEKIFRDSNEKNGGFSVRCIKD